MGINPKSFGVAGCAASILLPLIVAAPGAAQAQSAPVRLNATSINRPLPSLTKAVQTAQNRPVRAGQPRMVPNMMRESFPLPSTPSLAADPILQAAQSLRAPASIGTTFFGADNNDNGAVVGFLIAPPDTDGSVGPNHFVQMINLVTTIYDKTGTALLGPFASNAFWAGIGGNCEAFNQGDPIVLYDESADRWLVSQFAFPDSFATFSQCVAISQSGDPAGAYNRYEFSFNGIGFNDYPKHGIVDDAITVTANLFVPPFFAFGGSYLGVMDKNAMYAGNPATMLGQNIGTSEFGFVAGDLDGSGSSPALFATAMSRTNLFDIWQATYDFSAGSFAVNRIAGIPISPYDAEFCPASREACIPQPNGGPQLEVISDRLMHRLQLRDFGAYRTMVTAHSVDVGGGRAGIRWYEMRESGGTWSMHQEGTYGPADGENRWMPSIAMNAAGDIGLGYLVSSTNTFVSTGVAGQTAAASGTGTLDTDEVICSPGSGVQQGANRSGDYSSTSIDPTTGNFWHTNEVFRTTGNFQWATAVCEFSVSTGGGNIPPNAAFTFDCTDLACTFDGTGSSDADGTVDAYAWDFGDGNSASGATASNTFAAPGTYTVVLTVTDNEGATGTDSQSVTVDVPNVAPVASFTFSCDDLACSFDGSGSTDSDGTIVSYDWTFGDGNSGTGATTSNTYAAAGTYSVTLTVTDEDGATGSTSQDVTVTGVPNVAPTASFTFSCDFLSCDFDGSGSSDSDGSIVSYAWNFGDGTSGTGATTSNSYAAAGTFTVTLIVTDDDGATGSTSQDVTVTEPPNVGPTAAFSFSCDFLTCSFDGSGSSDSDGNIVSYSWDFGDGNSGTGATPSNAYAAAGTFQVSLTVTDDDGATDTVTQSVTTTEPPNSNIVLTLDGRQTRRRTIVDLRWSGATGKRVTIYRTGAFGDRTVTTRNDSFFRDRITVISSGTINYQVCEEGSRTVCSEIEPITF